MKIDGSSSYENQKIISNDFTASNKTLPFNFNFNTLNYIQSKL